MLSTHIIRMSHYSHYLFIALGLFVIFVSALQQSKKTFTKEHLSIHVEIPKALENAEKTILQGNAFLVEEKLIDPYIIYVKRQQKWSHVFFILQNPSYIRTKEKSTEDEIINKNDEKMVLRVFHHSLQSKYMFLKVLSLIKNSSPNELRDYDHIEHIDVNLKDDEKTLVQAFNDRRPVLFTCFIQPFYFQPQYFRKDDMIH